MLRKLRDNRLQIGTTSLGGALAVIVTWIIESTTGKPVPSDVAVAMGVVLGALISQIFAGEKEGVDSSTP